MESGNDRMADKGEHGMSFPVKCRKIASFHFLRRPTQNAASPCTSVTIPPEHGLYIV